MRLILLFAMLLLIAPLHVGQTSRPTSPPTETKPVKQLPVRSPRSAEIQLLDFKFEQMLLGREGPGLFPIEGEPAKGRRYFVEALLFREEAIATAKFEAVDARGVFIQAVRILRRSDAYGHPNFYGVMVVPDRPFRLVVSGEGFDGQRYRSAHERLFRPTARAAADSRMPKLIPDQARLMEEMMRQSLDELEKELQKLPEGVIVMTRQRVSNVTYAPFLSPSGRPLGVRVNYDVEFSQDGYYNPELHVFPFYEDDQWRGRIEMKVLNGSIVPEPTESGSPQIQPNILAYGAGYIYKAGTVYHFMAEMVPDFALQNQAKTKFCVYDQKFKYSDRKTHAIWAAIRSSESPTLYKVYIKNSDFNGIIERFYAPGAFYKSFVAEGARDCGEQPTIRF